MTQQKVNFVFFIPSIESSIHIHWILFLYVSNVWGNDSAGGFVYFFGRTEHSEKIQEKMTTKKSFNFSKPSLKQHLLSP